jgi:hypothetical protein
VMSIVLELPTAERALRAVHICPPLQGLDA